MNTPKGHWKFQGEGGGGGSKASFSSSFQFNIVAFMRPTVVNGLLLSIDCKTKDKSNSNITSFEHVFGRGVEPG